MIRKELRQRRFAGAWLVRNMEVAFSSKEPIIVLLTSMGLARSDVSGPLILQ